METDREVLQKAERGLGQAVYELTWAGRLYGPIGAIRVSRMRARFLRALGEAPDGLSALSSTYYTASGNAAARAVSTSGFSKLRWWVCAVWCLCRAVIFSDRLELRVGLSGMNPDQLDVRASILRKVGRYEASIHCCQEALSRDGLLPDTQALLRSGLAETLAAWKEPGAAMTEYTKARALCDLTRPTTTVRVLRSFGAHLLRIGQRNEGRDILYRALAIAREYKLGDQETKIGALISRYDLGNPWGPRMPAPHN